MKKEFGLKRFSLQNDGKKMWIIVGGIVIIFFVLNVFPSKVEMIEMPVQMTYYSSSVGLQEEGGWDIEDGYEKIEVAKKSNTTSGKVNRVVVIKSDVEEKLKMDTKSKTSTTTKPASEFILQDSAARLLTREDINKLGLNLREINYAKNEIYARHGRKFQSPELQNYFNSKSWYKGTVEPDAFGENMLSEVEKKNAELLRDIEFGINPNGYQLDAG